jgi:hypothetical protein
MTVCYESSSSNISLSQCSLGVIERLSVKQDESINACLVYHLNHPTRVYRTNKKSRLPSVALTIWIIISSEYRTKQEKSVPVCIIYHLKHHVE